MATATATTEAVWTPLGVRLTSFVPHYPHPPQEALLAFDGEEALYGGAAGGGKSDALLMAALQYVDVPGYAALLLRKTYPELTKPGGLLERSKQWLTNTPASWNGETKTWTFPSGAKLAFGHVQHPDDRYQYGSTEFQLIGIDELTEFSELVYQFFFSRLRGPSEGPLSRVPLRMRGATNPGGAGHRWVKRRFVDRLPNPADPDDTPERCRERIFIRAKLDDNPSIDRARYRRMLAALDPQTRAQLEAGDWTVRAPGDWVFDHLAIDAVEALGRQLDALRAAGEAPPPAGGALQLGIDWGEHTTACEIGWPLERGGLYVPPGELELHGVEPADATQRMLLSASRYDWPLDEARYDAAGAQSMRTFAAQTPDSVGLWKVAFAKHKQATIGYLRQLMQRAAEGHTTRVLAVSPENGRLFEQLRSYRFNDRGEIVKESDHQVDALIALCAPIAARHRELVEAM